MYTMTVSPNLAVGDLPTLVAIEDGLFARRGLDVSYIPKAHADNGQVDPLKRQKERLLEERGAHTYNACEWGSHARSHLSSVPTQLFRRAAVLCMSLVVRADGAEVPEELAGTPVAVSWNTGSHYMCPRLLDGFVGRDDVRPVHVGHPPQRLAALMDDRVQAAMLTEPYTSVAERDGARVIAEGFFFGADIVDSQTPPEAWAAFTAGVSAAVDLLRSDIGQYVPMLLRHEGLEESVRPQDVNTRRLRYVQPRPFTDDELARAERWMSRFPVPAGA